MSDVFLRILNASISASWLILAVIAARFLLRRAPRWLVCCLWMIVAVRLMMPVSIEMPFSLIPSAEAITPESMYDVAPVIDSGVEIIDASINPIYTESFRTDGLSSVNPLQIWMAIGANIWFLGMAGMWIWTMVSWLRLKKRVGASVLQRGNIYICDDIDTPFILGVFRPKIYLPSTLDAGEQAHVIAHENAHLHRRDHWWKPLGYLLLSVFWFNPLMWVAYILLCRDIELACDEKVIHAMNVEEKKGYTTALLECSIRRRDISACPLAFGEVGVKARVKSVLSYKKPAFWVIVIGILVCAVLALGFLTDPITRTPEIRYNGALYIQDGVRQNFIPPEAVFVGELQTGIVDTADHPTEDFQSVNLEDEYAGSDLYWYEAEINLELVRMLYVESPRGGYLPFRLRTPNDLIVELIGEALDVRVDVFTENTMETENLLGDRLIAMELALDSLRHGDFIPGSVEENAVKLLNISFERQGEIFNGIRLTRYAGGQWELTIFDENYGPSTWLVPDTNLCDDLENQITKYLSRAEYGNGIFEGQEFDDPDVNVHVSYKTFVSGNISLWVGIPYVVDVWEVEEIESGQDTDHITFRYRPQGAENGWVNVHYYAADDVVVHLPAGTQETVIFENGIQATKVTPIDGDVWMAMQIHTTQGLLIAATEEVDAWWPEHGEIATAILGTISVHVGGVNVLADANRLGIHLSVANVTPTGLTLVCQQDGTIVEQLHTGTPFAISRYENGLWTPLETPEDTVWTMVALHVPSGGSSYWEQNWSYLFGELPPGRYRISKSFSGKLPQPGTVTALLDWTSQTCYAEFIIE